MFYRKFVTFTVQYHLMGDPRAAEWAKNYIERTNNKSLFEDQNVSIMIVLKADKVCLLLTFKMLSLESFFCLSVVWRLISIEIVIWCAE